MRTYKTDFAQKSILLCLASFDSIYLLLVNTAMTTGELISDTYPFEGMGAMPPNILSEFAL